MDDPIALASLWYAKLTFGVALVAVALTVTAICVAFVAIRRADLNSSAATLVVLHDGFRGSWEKFRAAQGGENEAEKRYQFGDMMNLIEISAGLHHEKSLKGVSEELSAEYLKGILKIFKDNAEFSRMIRELADQPETFEYTREFCREHGLKEVFTPNAISPISDS